MIYKREEVSQLPIEERLLDKVDAHESKLVELNTIIKTFAENQTKMTSTLEKMSDSFIRQELLLEKMTNLEENTKNSIDRLHTRADTNATAITTKAPIADMLKVQEDLKVLEPVTILLKYPKLLVFTIVGFYVFSIKEFRDTIFGGG